LPGGPDCAPVEMTTYGTNFRLRTLAAICPVMSFSYNKLTPVKRKIKSLSSALLSSLLRGSRQLRENVRRLRAHATLSADLAVPLPGSTVVLGLSSVFGTGNIRFGQNVLLYPGLHLETQGDARIEIGDDVVISRGTHIVAMKSVLIGRGTMIGEYTSIRDANHARDPAQSIRESGHTAKAIVIGEEVWIGRGVAVLGGVTIGDHATVGANAVVTRNVEAGETAVGIPARPILRTKPV
jgi:acetyltransferase-like isoleucine patch superfamily enzyme